MKLRSLGAVTGALALTAALTPTAQSADAPDRILGGGYADSNFGLAVVYIFDGVPNCSASVLDSNSILTAKHCVHQVHSVRVGSLRHDSGGTLAYPAHIARHSSSDLAVITLDRDVSSPTVRLATQRPSPGETHSVWGWGRENCDEPTVFAPSLKGADVTYQGIGTDGEGGISLDSSPKTGQSSKGDSGGPQINPAGEVVGVSSTAWCPGDISYTSVPDYRSWILNQM